MGLDITIKTASDQPLGSADEVNQVLTQVFPGIRIGVSSSGREKLDYAAKKGIEFSAALRENLLLQPAQNEASFVGDGFSLQLHWPIEDLVDKIDAVAYFKGLSDDRLCEHLARLPMDRTLPRMPITSEVWSAAAKCGSKAREAGLSIPATDLLIFTCAKEYGLPKEHNDRHYELLENLK